MFQQCLVTEEWIPEYSKNVESTQPIGNMTLNSATREQPNPVPRL